MGDRICGEAIPAHVLRLMSPEDRPKGPAGMLPEDCAAATLAGEERELQKQVRQFLNLKDIAFINSDPRKKSPLPEGWPDFTLAYRGVPIGLEMKTIAGKLSADQSRAHAKLSANGWVILTPRSLQEVQRLFREIDARLDPPAEIPPRKMDKK